jgi:hypothetical protein
MKRNFNNIIFGLAKVIFLNTLDAVEAMGQSLLVGIPSAEVVHKGSFEFTHESQTNFWNSKNKVKWNSFNFFCYGIGHETEVTVNLINLSNESNSNLSTAIGVKKVFPVAKKRAENWNAKITVGQNLLYSIQKNNWGSWSYAHVSGTLPSTKTQLIGGFSYGTSQMFGYRYQSSTDGSFTETPVRPFCFIGGFVQPVFKNVSVVGDWYSGSHDLAAFIPAIQFDKIFKKHVFIVGYKLPNTPESGSQALITELMIRF